LEIYDAEPEKEIVSREHSFVDSNRINRWRRWRLGHWPGSDAFDVGGVVG
jgi:hypothetical protein